VCLYIKPRYILFENVAAFTTDNEGANMQKALSMLVNNGYQVRFNVLRAMAYGIPQNRHR
jgi:site-specific DNA-cytosine methylase